MTSKIRVDADFRTRYAATPMLWAAEQSRFDDLSTPELEAEVAARKIDPDRFCWNWNDFSDTLWFTIRPETMTSEEWYRDHRFKREPRYNFGITAMSNTRTFRLGGRRDNPRTDFLDTKAPRLRSGYVVEGDDTVEWDGQDAFAKGPWMVIVTEEEFILDVVARDLTDFNEARKICLAEARAGKTYV